MDSVTGAFVWFSRRKFVILLSGLLVSVLLQGSPLVVDDRVAVGSTPGKEEVAIEDVDRTGGVNVAGGVGLGVLVGGWDVLVGMDCCVAATIVHAAATAVPWTSAGLMVGGVFEPQAELTNVRTKRIGSIFLFILCLSLLSYNIYCLPITTLSFIRVSVKSAFLSNRKEPVIFLPPTQATKKYLPAGAMDITRPCTGYSRIDFKPSVVVTCREI